MRLRALLTIIGIAAGVSSTVATGAANDAILQGFRSTLDAVSGTADLVVTGGVPGGLSDDLTDKVRAVKGVKSASPAISEIAKLTDGTRLQLFGVDLAAGDDSRGFNAFAAGDAMPDPLAFLNDPDALLVSKEFAKERGLKVGDKLRMRTSLGVHDFHVLGLVADGGAAKAFGGRVAVMDLYSAEAAFGRGPHVDRIDVTLAKGFQAEEVRRALELALGPGPTVRANKPHTHAIEHMLRSFQVGLAMGASVSLFVGLFLVFNTVSFAVAQRRREIGTLRSLGVCRAQIVSLFAAEAAAYGVVGASAGVGLGALLAHSAVKQALSSINNAYLSMNVGAVHVSLTLALAALATGVAGAVVAALVPAWEAARVPPVDALRRDLSPRSAKAPSIPARLAGVAVALLSVPLLRLPLVHGAPVFGNLALAVIALGAAMLAGTAVEVVHAVAKRPVARLFGAPGRIALAGLVRERRRSGVAAGAVLIGIALVLTLGTFVASFRTAMGVWIERAIPADLFVASGAQAIGLANTPMQPEVVAQIASVPGVEEVQPVRVIWSEALGLRVGLYALEYAKYVARAHPLVTMGDVSTFARGLEAGGVLVSDNLRRKKHLVVGDRIALVTPKGEREFPIVGSVVDYSSDQGVLVFDRSVFVRTFDDRLVDSVDIYLAKGVAAGPVRDEIERRLGDKYDLRVTTNGELRAVIMKLIDDFFSLVYALLFIAVAVGVLGVVGTLLAQVLERTREIGILRATGASGGQIVGAVVLEAALLGVSGVALGVPAGLLMGRVFVQVIGVQTTGWMFPTVFPVALGISTALASMAFAALGGVLPARRAARLDIVEAIAWE